MCNEITFEDLHELPDENDVVLDSDVHTEQDKENLKNFGAIANKATIAKFEEKCGACRGSGSFHSYTGRLVGPCFKCKGTGTRKFKTSPETRAKAAEKRVLKRKMQEDNRTAKADSYKEQNAELVSYMNEVSGWNGFAAKMLQAIEDFGSLTDNQKAAVEKMQAKHVAKNADRIEQEKDGIDLSDLPSGTYAVSGGDTRLKIAVRRPGKNSKWHGWTFVDDGAAYGSRQNYGRQGPGKMYVGKCVEQLTAIAADPKAAMAAYGKLTGTCGMCGRLLEDEKSVEIGIGPICLTKF